MPDRAGCRQPAGLAGAGDRVGTEPATKVRATFSVSSGSPTVRVGQKAPSTKTLTASDAGGSLARISTDTSPDPAFYRISEDAALAKHDPIVVIFATPKFCQ